jgi:hypothetical protein
MLQQYSSPHRSRTTQFALALRLGMEDLNSSNDWKLIKDLFNGANDSSLRATLRTMIDSAETDLDQVESAYLKLNLFARSLKACLEDLTESDASETLNGVAAEPSVEDDVSASEDTGGVEKAAWSMEADQIFQESNGLFDLRFDFC